MHSFLIPYYNDKVHFPEWRLISYYFHTVLCAFFLNTPTLNCTHSHTHICKSLFFYQKKESSHKLSLCLPSSSSCWLVAPQTGPFTTFGWYTCQETSKNVAAFAQSQTTHLSLYSPSATQCFMHLVSQRALNVPVEKWLTVAWKRCSASFPYQLCAANF